MVKVKRFHFGNNTNNKKQYRYLIIATFKPVNPEQRHEMINIAADSADDQPTYFGCPICLVLASGQPEIKGLRLINYNNDRESKDHSPCSTSP